MRKKGAEEGVRGGRRETISGEKGGERFFLKLILIFKLVNFFISVSEGIGSVPAMLLFNNQIYKKINDI